MAGDTTENELAQTRVRIGSHRQQVTAELARRGEQPGSNHPIHRLEHHDIRMDTVQREISSQFRRARTAPLIAIG